MKTDSVFGGLFFDRRAACMTVLALCAIFATAAKSLAQSSDATPPATIKINIESDAQAITPLEALVAEAERNNPEIAAAEHGWKAAGKVAPQVSTLPDTEFVVQHFTVGSPRPFAGYSNSDFAYIGFGVSQELPFPGKLGLRAEVANRGTDLRREESDAVRRLVIESVKIAYLQLAYAQQALRILEQNLEALKQIEQIAEIHYRVGKGNQQDIIKAQLEKTKLLREMTRVRMEEGKLQAQLKQWLNRPQNTSDIVTTPTAATPLALDSEQLRVFAVQQNPAVKVQNEMVKKQEAEVALAKKEFRPDFNLQYMYQRNADQFRDYYMVTFGIRLPRRGRQNAALAQAVEEREKAKSEREAELLRAQAAIQDQHVAATTTEAQMKIYREGLIPQAEAALRAAMAGYENNRQDFESMLAAYVDVLNFQLDYQRELMEHETALARLSRLTGEALR